LIALQRPDTMMEAVSKYIRDAIVSRQFRPWGKAFRDRLGDGPQHLARHGPRSPEGARRHWPRRCVPPPGRLRLPALVSPNMGDHESAGLLEPYAARLALEASGSSRVYQEEVQSAFDRLRQATIVGDPIAVADADAGFHRAVFLHCGHQMLLDRLDTLQIMSRRVVLTNQLISADAATHHRSAPAHRKRGRAARPGRPGGRCAGARDRGWRAPAGSDGRRCGGARCGPPVEAGSVTRPFLAKGQRSTPRDPSAAAGPIGCSPKSSRGFDPGAETLTSKG
jgi:FCD domain